MINFIFRRKFAGVNDNGVASDDACYHYSVSGVVWCASLCGLDLAFYLCRCIGVIIGDLNRLACEDRNVSVGRRRAGSLIEFDETLIVCVYVFVLACVGM